MFLTPQWLVLLKLERDILKKRQRTLRGSLCEVMSTAPLGDVEPLDMPFVWSALAKLQALQANPRWGPVIYKGSTVGLHKNPRSRL